MAFSTDKPAGTEYMSGSKLESCCEHLLECRAFIVGNLHWALGCAHRTNSLEKQTSDKSSRLHAIKEGWSLNAVEKLLLQYSFGFFWQSARLAKQQKGVCLNWVCLLPELLQSFSIIPSSSSIHRNITVTLAHKGWNIISILDFALLLAPLKLQAGLLKGKTLFFQKLGNIW